MREPVLLSRSGLPRSPLDSAQRILEVVRELELSNAREAVNAVTIRSRLATRLPARQVEILTAGHDPERGDVVVAIVEREREGPTLGSSQREFAAWRASEKTWETRLATARKNQARVIWALVDDATLPRQAGQAGWAEQAEDKVRISGFSFNAGVAELCRAIEHPRASLWDASPLEVTGEARPPFHVFLCYHSEDKPAVREIAKRLAAPPHKIRYWFDEEQRRPGTNWLTALGEQIETIGSAAVFVGSSGIGPWQNQELQAFISEFVRRECPVIPVILSTARQTPKFPVFLTLNTLVDFRESTPDPLHHLIFGITGSWPITGA